MSDNNIKLSIEVADNLVEVQKRMESTQKIVDKLKNKLKGLEEEQKVVNTIFNEGKLSQEEYNKQSKKLDSAIKNVNNNLVAHTQALADVKAKNTQLEKTLSNTVIAEQVFNNLTAETTLTLSEMESQLAALKDIPLDGLSSGQIEKVGKAISELNTKIVDTKVKIESLDTRKVFENIGGGLKVIAESTNILITGLSALGVESETLNKLQDNTNKLISVTQSLATVTDFLVNSKYKLIAANIKSIALKIKDAVATKAQAATFLILGQSANSASLGFKVLRAALISTGIGALIVGIGILIANMENLINFFSKTSQAERALQNVQKQTIKNALDERTEFDLLTKRIEEAKNGRGDLSKAIDSYNKKFGDTQKLTQDIINDEEKYKAVLEERAQLIQDQAKEKALIEEIKKLKEKEAEEEQKLQKLKEKNYKEDDNKYLKAQKNLEETRKGIGELTTAWDNVRISIDGAVASQEKMANDAKAEKMAIENMPDSKAKELKLLALKEQEELAAAGNSAELKKQIEIKYRNARNDIARKYNEKYNNDAFNSAAKAIDLQLKQDEANLKAEEARLIAKGELREDDFVKQQDFQKRSFQLQHSAEMEKLTAQLAYHQITRDEFDKHRGILLKSEQEFNDKQIAETEKFVESQRKQINELIGQGVDNQIEGIANQYDSAIKSIDVSDKLRDSNPDKYTANLAKVQKLEEQKQAHIDKIKKDWSEKQTNEEISKLEEKYKKDFEAFENNELGKLKLLKKIHEMAKEKGANSPEIDSKIKSIDSQIDETEYKHQIELAKNANKDIYELEKERLEKRKREIEESGQTESLEYAQLLNEIADFENNHLQQQQEKWLAYADTIKGALSSVFEFMNQLGEAEVQRAEEENKAKKDSLQAQLDAGAVSQREYNKQVEQADKDLDKKKADIARKQAIRDKAMKAIEITINTASAIMRAWSDSGPFGGPVFSAIIGALGAVQLATVLAAPLPKAAKGGLIRGASHAQGGVVLEAEGGEYIVNKRAAQANMPLLQSINQAGAIPFINAGSDGGFSQREYRRRSPQSIDYDMLAERIAGEFKNVQIYTNITDIDNMHKKMNLTDLDNTNF